MMIVVVPVRAAALGERWAVLGGLTGLLLVHQLCIVGLLCMDKMTDHTYYTKNITNPLRHVFGCLIQPLNHSLVILNYWFIMYVCMYVYKCVCVCVCVCVCLCPCRPCRVCGGGCVL